MKETLEKTVDKNILATNIAKNYINSEKTFLSTHAKQFSNNRFLYLAVKKKQYLNILFNTNMIDLKMIPIDKYYYQKLGSEMRRDAFGIDGGNLRKDIEIFDNNLNILVDTSYNKKYKYLIEYSKKQYLNDALGIKNKFSQMSSNNFEIIEEEYGDVYLKGVSSLFMDDVKNYGVIIVKEKIDLAFLDNLKKLTAREIIVLKDDKIRFSTLNKGVMSYKTIDKQNNLNYDLLKIGEQKMIVNYFTLSDYNNNPIVTIGICDNYKGVESLYKDSIKKFVPYQIIFSVVLLVFLYFTLKIIFRPLDKIIKGIDKIKKGDYESKLNVKTVTELKILTESINEMSSIVNEREKKFIKLNKEIEDTNKEILITLSKASEKRSLETRNHIKRVSEYVGILAEKIGMNSDEISLLKEGAMLHDIGKIGIPDYILNKPEDLTKEEFEIMKKHTIIGNDIFKKSSRNLLEIAALISLQHHEKWDGSGYPKGLKGEDIHIYGRITALADVFDALNSDRVYKEKWDLSDILKYIKSESGKHFDPKLVEIFFKNIDEFIHVLSEYKD